MFKWQEAYSCNIKEIDMQHQKLFELGRKLNELISLQDEFDHYDEIMNILTQLKEYTIYHFGYEEKLMDKYQFDGLQKHQKEHIAFVDQLSVFFKKNIDENQRKVEMDMILFIANWIEKHILQTDHAYKGYLNLKGVF